MGIGNWVQAQVTVKDAAAKAMVLTSRRKQLTKEGGGRVRPEGPGDALHEPDHLCAWG